MAFYGAVQPFARVGLVIKEYRKSQGMTQKQLAPEIGVEARTLRMYENGERTLENITVLQRIADLLAIDPVELGLAPRPQQSQPALLVAKALEQVRTLVVQARLLEAHAVVDMLLKSVKKLQSDDDARSLHALALAYNLAGQIHALTCRTRDISTVLQHFQAMERCARLLEHPALLAMALSYQGDILRHRGDSAQAMARLEEARTLTSDLQGTIVGDHALQLAGTYFAQKDLVEWERCMQIAEETALSVRDETALFTFYGPATVYGTYACNYARLGQPERSNHYLTLMQSSLTNNPLSMLQFKAVQAELQLFQGDIVSGIPLSLEVVHFAQMYGHQRLQEHFYALQSYLDDQAGLLQRAARSLRDALHGPIEYNSQPRV